MPTQDSFSVISVEIVKNGLHMIVIRRIIRKEYTQTWGILMVVGAKTVENDFLKVVIRRTI